MRKMVWRQGTERHFALFLIHVTSTYIIPCTRMPRVRKDPGNICFSFGGQSFQNYTQSGPGLKL